MVDRFKDSPVLEIKNPSFDGLQGIKVVSLEQRINITLNSEKKSFQIVAVAGAYDPDKGFTHYVLKNSEGTYAFEGSKLRGVYGVKRDELRSFSENIYSEDEYSLERLEIEDYLDLVSPGLRDLLTQKKVRIELDSLHGDMILVRVVKVDEKYCRGLAKGKRFYLKTEDLVEIFSKRKVHVWVKTQRDMAEKALSASLAEHQEQVFDVVDAPDLPFSAGDCFQISSDKLGINRSELIDKNTENVYFKVLCFRGGKAFVRISRSSEAVDGNIESWNFFLEEVDLKIFESAEFIEKDTYTAKTYRGYKNGSSKGASVATQEIILKNYTLPPERTPEEEVERLEALAHLRERVKRYATRYLE